MLELFVDVDKLLDIINEKKKIWLDIYNSVTRFVYIATYFYLKTDWSIDEE